LESPVDILLVDDNPNNLLALEAILGNINGRFVKASSGAEALKCLLGQDFALIILDIQMPDMDGFETAEMIRGRERSRRIPIIFLTAFNRSDTQVHKGYALGAVDFLFKPIFPEVLRSKVHVFVDLFRKTEEVRKQAELLRDVEKHEHERRLAEEKQRWEAELLRQQVEQERQVSQALALTIRERERAEEALRLSNARLRLLADTANQLLFSPEPRRFLSALYGELAAHLGLEVYNCYLVEHRQGSDELVSSDAPTWLHLESASASAEGDGAAPEWLEFGQGVPGTVAQLREELVVREGDPGMEGPLQPLGLKVFVCYPMMADGRLIGTLGFGTRSRARIEDDEIDVVHIVGDQSAMALERHRLVAELQSRAEALAEADRRKDEFLAMLAHELRNPLVPIMTGLKTFQMIDPGSPKLQRARDAMERQVRHMVRLVDDLLDVSRVTAGKIELRKDLVDVATIVQQAVQTSQPMMAEKQHELRVALPTERLELIVDPARLAQIVSNLLSNAAKYTDNGGRIELSAASVGELVELRVRDNGRGIRPEMLPQVFGLFVQSDRTLDMAQGGLGVGLTLVKRLVELHGGTIMARSAGEGTGSEFIVRLPGISRQQAASYVPPPRRDVTGEFRDLPAAAPPGARTLEPVPRRLRILVVDDNPDIRATLHDLLEMQGHEVDVAEDGPQALERVLASRPDVALVDIGLPGMDGFALARALRQDPAMRTRLVAMTGYGQAEDRRRALDAGFEAHIVKPVEIDDLSRLLQEQP
jgi:signal transduction histidine kinase/DNA-binding response OmpR family regulator